MLILQIVASLCGSPTDFTLGASREGCTVIEHVDNQLMLKMSPRSSLSSSPVNNGTVPMRENGGGVAGSSAHFLIFRGRSYSFLRSMADQAYRLYSVIMEEHKMKPASELLA